MKFLHVSSVYDEIIKSFEFRNPEFINWSYKVHFDKFINYSRGQEFSYSYYFKQYGIETNVFYINYKNLEKKYLPNINKKILKYRSFRK